jgi:K+-sensing histidine kinase KdpD
LARPVVHECNNFLNNLLLQLAISENDIPESHRADWDRVRHAGKKLGRLLQDWQRQPRPFTEGPARTAFQPVVQEIVDRSKSQGATAVFSVRLPEEPLWLACPRAELKRLCCILLRYAIAQFRELGETQQELEIQAHRRNDEIILQIQEVGPAPTSLSWRDFDAKTQGRAADHTLLVAACESMTERLGGRIRVESASGTRPALVLGLPAAI